MVYLVHLVIGYTDLYFKFECLDYVVNFVERIKKSHVKELSDDVDIKEFIQILTNDEYREKIEKSKGE